MIGSRGSRALVTGGGGQLARELAAAVPPGIEVLAPASAQLDITDDRSVERALAEFRPDIVINAAAYTAVDDAEGDAQRANLVNNQAVRSLAESCAARGTRLVQISTDYVFDGRSPEPYRPDHPTNPLSVYGRTKRDGEIASLGCGNSVVLRTAWVYAGHGRNFLGTMLRLMSSRDEVRVVSDQIGSPTSARRLARAVWDLARSEERGIHHWTDAGVASWYDFAVAIAEEAAALGAERFASVRIVPIQTCDFPTRAVRPAMSVLNKARTWQVLPTEVVHWRKALRETMQGLGLNQPRAAWTWPPVDAAARPQEQRT